jgi:hypothetical protein
MSGTSAEWRELTAAWRADEQPPAGLAGRLRERTRTARRAMIAIAAAEAGMLVALAVLTGVVVAARGGAFWIAWAATVWLLALGMQAFALWNRRGTWRAATLAPADCIALSRRRAEAKVRTARFVRLAVALAFVAVVALFTLADSDGRARPAMPATLLGCAGLGAAYVGWSFWFQRRARRDLDELAVVERLLGAD